MKRTVFLLAAVLFTLSVLADAGDVAWSATASTSANAPSSSAPGQRPFTIQTVPAVAGARFAIDGRVLVTGKDGAVRTAVSKAQRSALALDRDAHLSVVSPTVDVRTGVRAQFAGWYDGGYHFSKSNPSGQLLLAAFDFYFLTTFKVVDGSGKLVQSVPVHDLVLHSSTGATVTLNDPNKPAWLRGLRVASSAGHLAVDDLSYTASSLMAKGNNVVRKGEQRFRPGRNAQVTIRSLFFPVQFRAHDAFFGRALGSTLELQFTDGSVQRFPLHNGVVTVSQLPRGTYTIRVNTFGLNEHHSVSISRSQTVSLPVLNALDMAIVAAFVLAIGGALLLLALFRRRRSGRRRRKARTLNVGAPVLEPSRSLSRL